MRRAITAILACVAATGCQLGAGLVTSVPGPDLEPQIQGTVHLPAIRHCESLGDYTAVRPSVHRDAGGWQMITRTWEALQAHHTDFRDASMGEPMPAWLAEVTQRYRYADHAPRWVQDAAALVLFDNRGTRDWNCAVVVGVAPVINDGHVDYPAWWTAGPPCLAGGWC